MSNLDTMVLELKSRNVRRIHVLAWRDLEDPDAGGSEIHADAFMSRWQEAGLDIVHRTSAAAGLPSTAQRHGYEVIRRGGRMTVFPRTAVSELARRMGTFDALVEIWNGVPWLSPLWCRRPRLLVYHHVHGPMWDQVFPAPIAAVGRLVETKLAPPWYRSTPTVTLSNDSYEEMVHLGWPKKNLHIAPAGVEPFFSPGESRSEYPSVVAVGRLAPVKRFEALLEQIAITRRRVPNVTLTIVGEGPERQHLETWIRSHQAQDWITLAGRISQEQLRSLYRRSWLITSASLTEGWGLTLTEAAGCGTPAVATDVGGHRSSVLHEKTGRLAPLNSLGETLADVLLDHTSRQALGIAAEKRARTLSWDLLAEQVLAPLHLEVVRKQTH
ncbi:MAG: hypothetical protein RL119_386 [Actinomycetota bacterium]|jgi:glycosyltransferase involved in cell wall biosynthesis